MKYIKLCFAFMSLMTIGMISCTKDDDTSALLERLDETLKMKDVYEGYFTERVSVMKHILSELKDSSQIYSLNKRLADEYKAYSLDSTVTYLQRNKRIAAGAGDDFRILETDLMLAEEYAMTGYHLEALELLEAYREEAVPEELKCRYYQTYHILSGEMMAYTNTAESYNEKIASRDRYRNILLAMTGEGTYEWYDLKLEEAEQNRDTESMRKYAMAMIRMTGKDTREYAKACYFYQNTFKDNCEPEKMEWLIRSAIADVMCATKDYASLNTLSRILFESGDVDRAFHYTADHCMQDAIAFNGKLRPWQISQFFPEIEVAYQKKSLKQQRMMMTMVSVVSGLAIVLVLLLLFILKRQQILDKTRTTLAKSYMKIEEQNRELVAINRRLSELNAQMQEADKVKQEYIALFLSMVSENINTTRRYKNHVLKAIRLGKSSVLVEEIEALPPIDEDISEFYKMFDRTFVNLYPDFVDKFNGLLAEGAGIYPKGDDILTPELRLFALIKLGINDSSKIASLLHYSANTIYNYRAKIKNRALGDRNDFEDRVREL